MSSRKTTMIRAPKDIMEKLRIKFPNVSDSDLIRTTYNLSVIRAEVKLDSMNFANKLGSAIYGKNVWKKIKKE